MIEIERAPATREAFETVFPLLIDLHRVCGFAPMDVPFAAENVWHTLQEGLTFIARVNGKAVGILGCTETTFYYSPRSLLRDQFFYVSPEHAGGKVGIALLRAAAAAASERNTICLVSYTNPDRRPKPSDATRHALIAGFVPLGYTLNIR